MHGESFLPTFNRLREVCGNAYELTGDRLIVERVVLNQELTSDITDHEGKKISIILSTGAAEKQRLDGINLGKATFVRVLEVGKGFYDANGDVPLDTKVGSVVLVSGTESVRWWTNIFGLMQVGEHAIGVMAEDQILMRWKDDVAFNNYMRVAKIGFNDGKGL